MTEGPGLAVTHQEQIELLRQRIAQAQLELDALRRTGPEERFVEAYVITKALELQLEEQLRQPDR